MNLACVRGDIFSVVDLDTTKTIYSRVVNFKYYQLLNNKIYAVDDSSNIVIINLLDYSEIVYANDVEFNKFIIRNNMMYFYSRYSLYCVNLENNTRMMIYKSRSIIKWFRLTNNFIALVCNNGEIKLFQNDMLLWNYRTNESVEFVKRMLNTVMDTKVHLMRNGNIILYNHDRNEKSLIVIHNKSAPEMSYIPITKKTRNNWIHDDIFDAGVNRVGFIHFNEDEGYAETTTIIGPSSIRILDKNIISNNEMIHYDDDHIQIIGKYNWSTITMISNNMKYDVKSIDYYGYKEREFQKVGIIRYKDSLIFAGSYSISIVKIPKAGEYGLMVNKIFSSDKRLDHRNMVQCIMSLVENPNKIELEVEKLVEPEDIIINDNFEILDMF